MKNPKGEEITQEKKFLPAGLSFSHQKQLTCLYMTVNLNESPFNFKLITVKHLQILI